MIKLIYNICDFFSPCFSAWGIQKLIKETGLGYDEIARLQPAWHRTYYFYCRKSWPFRRWFANSVTAKIRERIKARKDRMESLRINLIINKMAANV